MLREELAGLREVVEKLGAEVTRLKGRKPTTSRTSSKRVRPASPPEFPVSNHDSLLFQAARAGAPSGSRSASSARAAFPPQGVSVAICENGVVDFWAWSDTNLFLARRKHGLELVLEHRSSAAPEPMRLKLMTDAEAGPFLRCAEGQSVDEDVEDRPLSERVLELVSKSGGPVRIQAIRDAVRVRMQSVVDVLLALVRIRCIALVSVTEGADPEGPSPL